MGARGLADATVPGIKTAAPAIAQAAAPTLNVVPTVDSFESVDMAPHTFPFELAKNIADTLGPVNRNGQYSLKNCPQIVDCRQAWRNGLSIDVAGHEHQLVRPCYLKAA